MFAVAFVSPGLPVCRDNRASEDCAVERNTKTSEGSHDVVRGHSVSPLARTPGRIQEVEPSVLDSNIPMAQINSKVELLFGSPRGLGGSTGGLQGPGLLGSLKPLMPVATLTGSEIWPAYGHSGTDLVLSKVSLK